MRPLWSRWQEGAWCVSPCWHGWGASSDPSRAPQLGYWDPSVLGGCGCPHPQMLIFSSLLLEQNKKMKQKHQKVKQERRRDGFSHFSPDPSPPRHRAFVMGRLVLDSFAAEVRRARE